MIDRDTGLYFRQYGSGKPVLLLHGIGVTSFTWRYVVEPLSRNKKVILVDLKGFGRSPKPFDDRYSISDQARIVARFIKSQKLQDLSIVGHSLGGGVALLLASSEVGVREAVSRLVLIDSAGYRQHLPFFLRTLRTPLVNRLALTLLPDEFNVKTALKAAYFDDAKISTEQLSEYARDLRTPEGRTALIRSAEQLFPKQLKSITSRYKDILVPVLIIWGAQDRVIPLRVAKQLATAIPNSRITVIENCGHMPQEETPEKILDELIGFL